MLDEGVSTNEIVRDLNCSESVVREVQVMKDAGESMIPPSGGSGDAQDDELGNDQGPDSIENNFASAWNVA